MSESIEEKLEKRLDLWKELLKTSYRSVKFYEILTELDQLNIDTGEPYGIKLIIDLIIKELVTIRGPFSQSEKVQLNSEDYGKRGP